MSLKPQNNDRSIPHPTGMQHGICNRQEEGGSISHQTRSAASLGVQQQPQEQDTGTKTCMESLPLGALRLPLPYPHHPDHREADGGQEFLTMG